MAVAFPSTLIARVLFVTLCCATFILHISNRLPQVAFEENYILSSEIVPPHHTPNSTSGATNADESTGIEDEQKPELSNNDEGFTACLLIKDDNHWLIEWLAFHYFVLPLRHLIVIQDPNSLTSANPILERYNGLMEIEYWTDDHVLPAWVLRKHGPEAGTSSEEEKITNLVRMHRYRQQFFYAQCIRHARDRKQSWLLLTDTDEFIQPNPAVLPSAWKDRPYESIMSQPGSVSTSLRLLMQERQNDTVPTCLYVPRIQLSSIEDETYQTTSHQWELLTERWLYHNGKEIQGPGKNLDGKNVIDVSRLNEADIPRKAENVHYIIPGVCPESGENLLVHPNSFLRILHYLGSWEQYNYRQDPRDGLPGRPSREETFKGTAYDSEATVKDTSMTAWVRGLTEQVGGAEAQRLLDGAGILTS